MRFVVLIVLSSLLVACPAKPPGAEQPEPAKVDPNIEALAKRITALESANRANENTANTRFEAISAKLDELQAELGEVRKLARKKPVAAKPKPKPRRRGPDPKVVYSVPLGGAPFEGAKNAFVTIVVGLEYSEPYSRKLLPVLDKIRSHYGKKIKIVYQNFIVHPAIGRNAALAVCAAGELGRHRDMIDAIWPEYDRYRNGDKQALNEAAMFVLADALGLSRRRFKRAYEKTCPKAIEREQAWFKGLGMTGVPGSFVNGRYVRGAQKFSKFEQVIDVEMVKAEKAIKAGTKLRRYYKSIVAAGDRGTN